MDILGMLTEQLGSNEIAQIGSQLGADQNTTQKAIAAALPMLIGALSNNANKGEGANALAGALDRDHDGGILDNLIGYLGSSNATQDDGILKHVLGDNRGMVESILGKSSGLDAKGSSNLLNILAPIIMGALGKAKKTNKLDSGGLSSILTEERKKAETSNPGLGGFAQLLDSDGDGDIKDDLLNIGVKMLGSFFSGKK